MRRLLQARPLLRLAGEGGGGRPRLQVGERHQNPGGVAGAAGPSCPAAPSSPRARGRTVGRRRQAVSVSRGAEQTTMKEKIKENFIVLGFPLGPYGPFFSSKKYWPV